jgi:hypothetical protein
VAPDAAVVTIDKVENCFTLIRPRVKRIRREGGFDEVSPIHAADIVFQPTGAESQNE